jgi:hypothetical protein
LGNLKLLAELERTAGADPGAAADRGLIGGS